MIVSKTKLHNIPMQNHHVYVYTCKNRYMNAYIHGQLATHRLRTHINEMRSVGMNHKKKQVTKDDKTSIKEGSLMQQYNSNNALQSISTKTKPCIMHIMMWD